MMAGVTRRLALASLMLLGACAAGFDPGLRRVALLSPPRIRGAGYPQLAGGTPSTAVRVDVVVMIDPTGVPDMTTLVLTGTGVEENRAAVVAWVRQSSFEPAMQNGRAVRAEFRASLETQTVPR